MNKPVSFNPDGNDLKRVLYYYNVDIDEKIVCPFHDDNRPSCHLNLEEGLFHCFACEASGDALGFVKLANPKISELNQLILYHAILNSKKVKGIKLSKVRNSKSKKQKEIDRENDMEIAHDYYYGLKTIDWKQIKDKHKSYIRRRGFSNNALNKCGAKLTITDDNYPLIFPIYDMDKFKGYVCRTTNKRVENNRKYLYNKGFSRNDTIGGIYDNKVVVLTEGFLDKIKMQQFGLKYVAAIFGWKITSKQVEKLKVAGVETIISALDTDGPGEEGTDYLHNFFDVVRFEFPEGTKDPGDLNKKQFDIAYRKTKNIYRSRRKNR